MLDEKETTEYIRRAKSGDQSAKQALIDGNVSLIKCIVKRYLGKGVEYDDLFQLAFSILKILADAFEKVLDLAKKRSFLGLVALSLGCGVSRFLVCHL